MASLRIQMRVRLRWWVKHYVALLVLFCETFDTEPNWERINWWLERGVKVEVWNGNYWRRVA